MSCVVPLCKFPDTHITTHHRCGKCKEYGHGSVQCVKCNECGHACMQCVRKLNKNLSKIYSLPPGSHCTVSNCRDRHTHSTSAHQSDFERYAYESEPEDLGIRVKSAVSKYPGTYAVDYLGLGCYIYARNNDNNIEVFSSDEDYTHFTNGYKHIPIPSDL